MYLTSCIFLASVAPPVPYISHLQYMSRKNRLYNLECSFSESLKYDILISLRPTMFLLGMNKWPMNTILLVACRFKSHRSSNWLKYYCIFSTVCMKPTNIESTLTPNISNFEEPKVLGQTHQILIFVMTIKQVHLNHSTTSLFCWSHTSHAPNQRFIAESVLHQI